MSRKVDLHTHSTYSDGTLEPEDLIQNAQKQKITHLALSDHDSTGGLAAARNRAKEFDITIIPAVEINTRDNETSAAVHILGYFLEETDINFQKVLTQHREIRAQRAQMIIARLHTMGIKLYLSDFDNGKNEGAVGRPHIADKLKEMGVVFSRQEAFDKYLSQGRPAFVAYENGPTPKDAIDAILSAKGIPVIAHPGYYVSKETILSLAEMGLQGVEVYYPSHSKDLVKTLLGFTAEHKLLATGGSDYHGPGSGHERLGEIAVPEETIDLLLERKYAIHNVN